jgi:hypothetical protein
MCFLRATVDAASAISLMSVAARDAPAAMSQMEHLQGTAGITFRLIPVIEYFI